MTSKTSMANAKKVNSNNLEEILYKTVSFKIDLKI